MSTRFDTPAVPFADLPTQLLETSSHCVGRSVNGVSYAVGMGSPVLVGSKC